MKCAIKGCKEESVLWVEMRFSEKKMIRGLLCRKHKAEIIGNDGFHTIDVFSKKYEPKPATK